MSVHDSNAGIARCAADDMRARLRRQRLAARAALTAADHAALSGQVCAHLDALLAPLPPRSLGACLPYRGECDLVPLLAALHDRGWSVSVPVVERAAAPMQFHAWHPHVALTQDRHGIAIPDSPPVDAPGILLLPVVAIDAAGFRLGYGGGYFDRTLAALQAAGHSPWCIGVGFALASVPSIGPLPHDRPVHNFVCELGNTAYATPPVALPAANA